MRLTFLLLLAITSQTFSQNSFNYIVDINKETDVFSVTLNLPKLSSKDSIYSFVSYAPGVHQPLDFGRFVKLFKAYNSSGEEIQTDKVSVNSFRIFEPEQAAVISYEIDDTFDMDINYHPVYPMSGTGINEAYTIINPHGVFGYFKELKNSPITLSIKTNGNPKIGTALSADSEGVFNVSSFYHLTDSPILIGEELSYTSVQVGDIKVEAYVHSPNQKITAEMVLEEAKPILESAKKFIGYAPVDRYTFLMYFSSQEDISMMPVLQTGGALEHSYSSTYALPEMPEYLPYLGDIIAHEYMHILSPLHLHSDILANFDYQDAAAQDQHVWLYEGVTEWVSFYMRMKSGHKSDQDYLKYLSEKYNNNLNYSTDYSLARISKEWSTDEGNKQYGNIYQLGALTAAMLDIKLIQLSNGEKGLRTVYLDLINKYGEDKPFNNDSFFTKFVELTFPEIEDFINQHIKSNTPFDFENEMKNVGINYYEKRKTLNNESTMGIVIRPNEDQQGAIAQLAPDYNGEKLKVGDIILGIDGVTLDQSTYHSIMSNLKKKSPGETYEIKIIRSGKEMTMTEELFPKYDYHVFEKDPEADKMAKKRRDFLFSKL